ncbi:MAG: isocitrate lyase/phosphoenolpyruvate mutase family protein [Candidatus Eremiobacteraeota bacterium]|nr:isocitrate lyase/phosphoenolpyruvate mutase family protein [Candidatus Eremiobacteraeota bacterium]MCW5872901.1 isocitrate lyase/phosphoenolpyruvate mutase family protein [Candidatus Eremiobacteraeota bacterium]
MTITQKRKEFRRLHESGCFTIPNAWDIGSARYLEHVGFKALATTSAGFAFTRGRLDGKMTVREVITHVTELAEASRLPLNVDFESGFAAGGQELADNLRRCAEAGAAGISIEDNAGEDLYDFESAVERIRVSVRALEGTGVMLVARSEGMLTGWAGLDETVRRLQAFAAAGADCLYAPGLRSEEEVRAVVAACAPKPVNVLVWSPGFTVSQLAALEVRRVSLGAALAKVGWAAVMNSAREIFDTGRFESFGQPVEDMRKFLC